MVARERLLCRWYLGACLVAGVAFVACADPAVEQLPASASDDGGAGATSETGSANHGEGQEGGQGGGQEASGDFDAGDPDSQDKGPAPTSDSASKQGTCTVASYTDGVPTAADYVGPTVYYPTDCPGPFPGVVIIPGFTELQSAVNQWGTFLASHGFVVMHVDAASGGTLNTLVAPAERAKGLAEGVETLKGENTRAGSPIAGNVDTSRMAVMGHSMGGGGTLVAANDHPELKAAIGLCPWNPGVTYPKDAVPSLVFAGTADGLVSTSHATGEYQSIPDTTPKVYAEFNGGTHYVASTPLGTAATDPVVARVGLSWLKVHLVGDARYAPFLVKDSTMSAWDMKP
jgi:dienelactone hydrolase